MRLINIKPSRPLPVFLTLLPFALVFAGYAIGSDIRLTANPQDKLLPAPATVWDTMVRTTARPLTKLSETSYSNSASVPQVRPGYSARHRLAGTRWLPTARELSYLPYPGPMVTERTNMGLVYVSLHAKHVEDLRSFMKNHKAAGTNGS